MANVNLYAPFMFRWEGGFVNHPKDPGGATNMGVTLATWKNVGYDKNGDGEITVEDLKLITKEEVVNRVLKPYYWNRWKADSIKSQSVANALVDWVWNSGKWGIIYPQRILNVKDDGVVGQFTIAAVNKEDPRTFFNKIIAERRAYFERIVENDPEKEVFLKGWMNRINNLIFTT